MMCPRCQGLLVQTEYHDDESGYALPMVRCVACGFITDTTIENNLGVVLDFLGRRKTHY